MKLNHLRDIVAVAQNGSLRAASRHLGIAQPVLTRSIRDTEQELGATLFERHARGVRLTTIGEAVVRRASGIQAEFQRLEEEVEQLKGSGTGEVSVAFSTASSMSLMPSAVTAFRKRYPDTILKMSEGFFQPIQSRLLSGEVDLYVGPLDLKYVTSRIEVEELFENWRVVIARKGHPAGAARRLEQLSGERWIQPAWPDSGAEPDFRSIFTERGLPAPNIVTHARSALLTLVSVTSSDLLTILPIQWLDSSPAGFSLEALPLSEALSAPPICIARRKDMPLTPVAEHLHDMMRRAAAHYVHRRAGGVPGT
ncbi:LysR substrate-binding domain-containing protein [uncultured Sphingomonas sp.]|uniref:LysR substrate-binding domain-containing protein n=1 Tax=uncultured Sphingomonas sp. TaxID=158754 RepID=UPI0035CA2853